MAESGGQKGTQEARETRVTITNNKGGNLGRRSSRLGYALRRKDRDGNAAAKSNQVKLPKLSFTYFRGTHQIGCDLRLCSSGKYIADRYQEKFGGLLEMVIPSVRERIANLKTSALGYKTAWENPHGRNYKLDVSER